MDSENKTIEAELLAREVKRRYELLRMAQGGWRCWTGFEIANGIVICIWAFYAWTMKDVVFIVLILFSMSSLQSSLTGRQINALIELIGKEKLLKVSDGK